MLTVVGKKELIEEWSNLYYGDYKAGLLSEQIYDFDGFNINISSEFLSSELNAMSDMVRESIKDRIWTLPDWGVKEYDAVIDECKKSAVRIQLIEDVASWLKEIRKFELRNEPEKSATELFGA